MTKKILMIAGPNGAGKTTTSYELIAKGAILYEFLNADEIAKGLAPLNPETMALSASKLMIKRLKELMAAGKSFAFETTAAGTNYKHHIAFAHSKGYRVHLTFLFLSRPQQAIERVAQRVKQGGHNIPEATIIRRYNYGIKNIMNLYLPMADTAMITDVSSGKMKLIAKKDDNKIEVSDPKVWENMEQIAYG